MLSLSVETYFSCAPLIFIFSSLSVHHPKKS